MGYERKRGKLAELNLLFRGGTGDGFSLIVGNMQELREVTYVITLDMELPRYSARQLAGAMSHPLNRSLYDTAIAYGILYLVSDESKFITGSELVIDGGYTCK